MMQVFHRAWNVQLFEKMKNSNVLGDIPAVESGYEEVWTLRSSV